MAVDCETATSRNTDGGLVRRLYTPEMLAHLLSVPAAAIRHWHRRGVLRASRSIGRLPYFDFDELNVARRLAQLYAAGCSLRTIDSRLSKLGLLLPHVQRPLADPAICIEGRRLVRRVDGEVAELSGQLWFELDDRPGESGPAVLRFAPSAREPTDDSPDIDRCVAEEVLEQLQQYAVECEEAGRLDYAIDAYRAFLLAAGPNAEAEFALADLLYRAGDLSAARERYYSVLSLDGQFVEAHVNLGSVLVELGEPELAVSAFEGALALQPDLADAHFHLGMTLERLHRRADAAAHLRAFLDLAPESPWAEAARDRLAE